MTGVAAASPEAHDVEAPVGAAIFNERTNAGSPGGRGGKDIRGASPIMTDALEAGSSAITTPMLSHNHTMNNITTTNEFAHYRTSPVVEEKPSLGASAKSAPAMGFSPEMSRPEPTELRQVASERKSKKSKSDKKKKKKSSKESKRSVTGSAMVATGAMVAPTPPGSGQHETTNLATIKQEGLPDWLLDHLEQQYNAAKSPAAIAENSKGYSTESTRSGSAPGHQEVFDLYDDIYSLMFLCPVFSSTMVFCILAFFLKVCLYLFLAIELGRKGEDGFQTGPKDRLVVAAQFFMLPVAVAIQEDLIGSYALVANIRYDKEIRKQAPDATCNKWIMAGIFRFVDGLMSLGINFCVLLLATDVLSLFLNFAALQFLQTIDNVAFGLAKDGYLTDAIEDVAELAATLTLPKKTDRFMNTLDTLLFLATFLVLLIGWIVVTVRQQGSDPVAV